MYLSGPLHAFLTRFFCVKSTQWAVLSATSTTAKSRVGNAHVGPKRRLLQAPTAVGGTADGTRRSTVGTMTMGIWTRCGAKCGNGPKNETIYYDLEILINLDNERPAATSTATVLALSA